MTDERIKEVLFSVGRAASLARSEIQIDRADLRDATFALEELLGLRKLQQETLELFGRLRDEQPVVDMMDGRDYELMARLVAEAEKCDRSTKSTAWHCANCGEPMQFFDGMCWDCFGGDPGQ